MYATKRNTKEGFLQKVTEGMKTQYLAIFASIILNMTVQIKPKIMRVAVCRTVDPNGRVKEYEHGMDVLEIRKPLKDNQFNLVGERVTKFVNKLYKIK
jgi:hypothetical protein